jgi:RimJ/RimL family protein N-acetyltransferase
MALSEISPRLRSIAADLAALDAELAGPAALAARLDAEVPADWPPGEWDRGAIGVFRDILATSGGSAGDWGVFHVVEEPPAERRRLVAAIGWFGPPDARGTAEIGFSVSAEARRRGVASGAVGELVARGFADPRLVRVIARTTAENRAAIGVLRRLGFVAAGEADEPGSLLFERRRDPAADPAGSGEIVLVRPSRVELPAYVAALERGWSPDNVRGAVAAREQLEAIADDPDRFLASLDDERAAGAPIALPDGTTVPRLPGFVRWIWDGGFCGSIGFRWRPGGSDLPAHVLGHIGYAVVPWKRRRGCATRALAALLPEARRRGLDRVELTTDPDNLASQKVILACGGRLVETFRKSEAYGGTESLRFRIDL